MARADGTFRASRLGDQRSVDGRSLLAGLSAGLRIRALERRADPLQGAVEVIVCRVQVIQDALKRRLGLHVVANGEKEPMGDIHED
ncbi:MAG TPA: hypothetical protein VF364_13410 [Candidatus Limnocylindria bacterium]